MNAVTFYPYRSSISSQPFQSSSDDGFDAMRTNDKKNWLIIILLAGFSRVLRFFATTGPNHWKDKRKNKIDFFFN